MPVASLKKASTHERRWAAVEGRDTSARFLYAVKTTGIYCRPGCASRKPRRENVVFFETSQAAERAGFRPCQRCTPASPIAPSDAQVEAMRRWLERAPARPSLREVAQAANLSPSHAQRLFVRKAGLSPRAYYELVLQRRLDRELPRTRSLLGAAHAAGFGSKSHLYAKTQQWFEATPRERKASLEVTVLRVQFHKSSLGWALLASSSEGLCALLVGDDRSSLTQDLSARFPRAQIEERAPENPAWPAHALELLEGKRASLLGVPLDLRGTPFQVRVWRALLNIPWGQTVTYSELARRIGEPQATRAVASACAKNPLAVLVPCHRVLRIDGDLGGYRWGLDNKRALLERELTSPRETNGSARNRKRVQARPKSR
jgi:AraC family transcriptional regulator, regulatory protein of adaptative response / methylated-DNA-[protein]-cysteine methyltransferase